MGEWELGVKMGDGERDEVGSKLWSWSLELKVGWLGGPESWAEGTAANAIRSKIGDGRTQQRPTSGACRLSEG